MKKSILSLLLLIPILTWSQATTGYHRVNQALARAYGSSTAQVMPYATVHVTSTATGAVANIYSDPLLSHQILSGTVTADANGNYDYYVALNYCVNEAVSAPGQGSYSTTNICQNGGGSGVVGGAAQFSVYGQPNSGTQTIANPLPNLAARADGTLVVGSTNTSSFGPSGSVWADGSSGSNMTRVGASALASQTTGFANTAVGEGALQNLTTGTWNVAMGHVAMQYATTIAPNPALSNTAVGNNALQFDLDGQVNTAFGTNVLINNTRGVSNDCSGKDACWSMSTGYQNTGHGVNALTCNNGFGNVALGYRAMFGLDSPNTTGIVNTSVGNSGGTGYVLGDILTVVQGGASGGTVTVEQVDGSGAVHAVSAVSTPGNGYAIANNLATTGGTGTGATIDVTELSPVGGCAPGLDQGQQNVAIGTNAMELNNGTGSGTGSQNVAVGAFSLHSNTIGVGNVGVGINSLVSTTAGTENVGVGNNACGNVTTGNDNICLGINSGGSVIAQDNTINIGQSTNALLNGVAVGLDALQNNTQQDNTAVGSFSLQSNTTGASNTGLGINALQANTTGFSNTAMGAGACSLITTGTQDICFGSGSSIGAAVNDSIAVGHSASATGGFSQAIGDAASVTGTNSVALGTGSSASCVNNCVAIGVNTGNSVSNTLQIGDSSITDAYFGTGLAVLHGASLANGMTAITQTTADTSTDVATDAFVHNAIAAMPAPVGCPSGTFQYPCLVGESDLTGQSANAGIITLLGSAASGTYRLDYYEVVTTAATSSSALPQMQAHYTDEDSSVAQWVNLNNTNAGNTVGSTNSANAAPTSANVIEAASGTSIQYTTANYASSGATAMQYAVHAKLWYLGP